MPPRDPFVESASGKIVCKVALFLVATICTVPLLLHLHEWIETTKLTHSPASHLVPVQVQVTVHAMWTASIDVRTPNATDCIRLAAASTSDLSCVCDVDDPLHGSHLSIPIPFVASYTVDLIAWPCSNPKTNGYVWQVEHHARWLSILLLLVSLAMLAAALCSIPWSRCWSCRNRTRSTKNSVSVYALLAQDNPDQGDLP
jgi:hypothetical protein